jgi:hypothetical protein
MTNDDQAIGGFEERLLADLKAMIAARAAGSRRAPAAAVRRPVARRARLLLAASVAAGLAAAGAVVVLNAPAKQVPRAGHVGQMTAATLLANVANASARQRTPAVTDAQYEYIASLDTEPSKPTPIRRQVWTSVSDICRPSLILLNGSRLPMANPGPECRRKGDLNQPSYRLLQSLPTDPRALLSLINTEERGHGPSPDEEAFTTIGDLLGESIAPPALGAALERAAALIPGVTIIPDAVDPAQRHGVGVAFTAGGVRSEWIFDLSTGQMIGRRDVNVKTGAVRDAFAVLARAFVDHPGDIPPAS